MIFTVDLLTDLKSTVSYFNNRNTVFNDRDSFYKTKQWIDVRAYIVERDKNECQTCKDRGLVTTNNLIVHHIEPIEYKPDLALEESNLITVCIGCHNYIHSNAFDYTDRKNEWNDEYW